MSFTEVSFTLAARLSISFTTVSLLANTTTRRRAI
jgi:hypothetical protein